jgi:hypothetical protein
MATGDGEADDDEDENEEDEEDGEEEGVAIGEAGAFCTGGAASTPTSSGICSGCSR